MMEEKKVLTYKQVGDYLYPDIEMDEQPEGFIGKYGSMRRTFLKEYRNGLYGELLLLCKLKAHLMEIDTTARERVEQLMKEMAKAEGVTEDLKMSDQLRWVGMMNNIKSRAEEIVLSELIYV